MRDTSPVVLGKAASNKEEPTAKMWTKSRPFTEGSLHLLFSFGRAQCSMHVLFQQV